METSIEELKRQVQELRANEKRVEKIELPSKIYEDMTMEEYQEIYALYGSRIREIKGCSKNSTEPFKFIQNTVKMMFPIDPVKVRSDYEELASGYEPFLTSFFTTKQGNTFRVILRGRTQNISFFDVSEHSNDKKTEIIRTAVASDRQMEFRMERDPLIRVTIYKVEMNLYFAIISMLCDDDGLEVTSRIVNKLFGEAVLYKSGQRIKSEVDTAARSKDELFWYHYLKGFCKQVHVPGYQERGTAFEKKSCRAVSEADILSKLETYANQLGIEITDVMEAAWAVLLYFSRGDSDILFGISDDERGYESVPLRVTLADEFSFDMLSQDIHNRKVQMKEHIDVTLRDMEILLGLETPLFNHIVSFHNMSTMHEGKEAPKSGKVLLGMVTYQEEQWNFCLHVRFFHERIAVNVIYNGCNYAQEAVESLLTIYMSILKKIAYQTNVMVYDLRYSDQKRLAEIEEYREAMELQIILQLSRIDFWSDLPVDELERVVSVSKLESMMSGDILLKKGDYVETADFIISGHVQLAATSSLGWDRPLMLEKEGNFVSNEWYLTESISSVTAIVNSDDTQLLRIPVTTMRNLMNRYSGVGQKVFCKEHERFQKMATLWINTD